MKTFEWIAGSLLLLCAPATLPQARAERAAPPLDTAALPDQIERGRYLSHSVLSCFDCHSAEPERLGAGGFCHDGQVGMPKVCIPNITPDRSTGIGAWSDAEISSALREGFDRKGRALFPLMPYEDYRTLSDTDAIAVVAYLRALPAIRQRVKRPPLPAAVAEFVKLIPKRLAGPVPSPKATSGAEYGEYLATVASCKTCHTPVDAEQQSIPGREFAGGRTFASSGGAVTSVDLRGPHLAPTRELFITRFRASAVKALQGARPAKPIMPWATFATLTDADLSSIYQFLKRLRADD